VLTGANALLFSLLPAKITQRIEDSIVEIAKDVAHRVHPRQILGLVWCAWTNHANEMVSKASVHVWNLDLRHVAVRTLFCGDRANRSRMIFRCPGRRRTYMASQALRIINGRVCRKWLVRIVAGNTSEALVPSSPTLAAHEAIRLHPNVGDSRSARELDVHPCALGVSRPGLKMSFRPSSCP